MILEGKKVIIMGVRNKWSIAWGAAQSSYQQGAKVICTCSADSLDKVKELVKELPGTSVYLCNDVSKDEDIENCLEEIKKELEGKVPNATGELQVWGLDEFDDSNMKYRIVVETKSNEQYGAQRFLRSEFKKGLDKRNIKVSYPQIEVHNGK